MNILTDNVHVFQPLEFIERMVIRMALNNDFNDFGSLRSLDRYGLENQWDRLFKDIAENMKDPFMLNELVRDIKEHWHRYWRYRDEFDRDSTALTNIKSSWRGTSISFNTEYTVYGDDARVIILRMRAGDITARKDIVNFAIQVKNIVNVAKSLRNAESFKDIFENLLEDFFSIITLLDDAMDQLIRDNALLMQRWIFEEDDAAYEAEKLLREYGGFKFRYNVSSLGLSIDISKPPFASIPSYYNTSLYDSTAPTSTPGTTATHGITYSISANKIAGSSTPASSYTTYTVKPGDGFWKIAAAQMGNGAKYEELARYNGLTPSSTIHPGDVLKIPR